MPPRSIRYALPATLCFLGAYLLASAADLWTTALALSLTTAKEGNAFALDSGVYDASRAWLFTGIASVPLVALFFFGVRNVGRIAERWLDHPWRSFLSLRSNPLVSLPWSKKVIDRSPLHAVSFALAFIVLRCLAAANNAMIAGFGVGPLGLAVGAVGNATSPAAGFVTVIGSLYVLLILAMARVVARFIKATRARAHAHEDTEP